MITVYYSPHGTSVDNEAGRASGHADVPLSAVGRQDAQTLGQHFVAYALDAVFCSDLQRAWTTAEIAFSGRKLPIVRDARLRECDFGKLTQCPPSELDMENHITQAYPGGESVLMVVERVGAFLRDIASDYDGRTILVIGHRATRYGLEYWSGGQSLADLENIVRAPWEWREVPIWRYEVEKPAGREVSAPKDRRIGRDCL